MSISKTVTTTPFSNTFHFELYSIRKLAFDCQFKGDIVKKNPEHQSTLRVLC